VGKGQGVKAKVFRLPEGGSAHRVTYEGVSSRGTELNGWLDDKAAVPAFIERLHELGWRILVVYVNGIAVGGIYTLFGERAWWADQ
jgi:hypothetical protein